MKLNIRQPWLHSAFVDLLFILSPPFLCLLAIIAFPDFFQQNKDMPVMAWVVLVLLIDVSHVYSTLFRTYLDKDAFQKHKQLLLLVPVFAWITGMIFYVIDDTVFWRVLAYLAVFHFVRQQYGFLQLYSRQEKVTKWERQVNSFIIYTATIYPLLYWHLEGKRLFNWFLPGDFISLSYPAVLPVLTVIYILIILAYVIKEIQFIYCHNSLNIPRNLVVTGTLLSWYLGIVYYNGDLIYTTFNVVSHGIPYLALVWIYGQRKQIRDGGEGTAGSRMQKVFYKNVGILLFVGIVALLAYVEEGLWDGFIWREHGQVFSIFSSLPQLQDSLALTVVVPLLALPQITHYVLDGFIWKVSRDENLHSS